VLAVFVDENNGILPDRLRGLQLPTYTIDILYTDKLQ